MTTMHRARLGLGLIDQILSSASNVLIVFAIARVSSVADFGALSLALAALTTVMATSRGLLGTPITLLSADSDRLRNEAGYALGLAAWGGLAAGSVIAIITALTDAPSGTYFIALAAPFMLMQDVGRFFCISAGLAWGAVLSDGFWALGSAALLLITWLVPNSMHVSVLLGLWVCLCMMALFAILCSVRLAPRFGGVIVWSRTALHDRLRFGASAVIGAVSSFLVLGIATVIIGVSASAALRGAGSVLGPLNIVMSAIFLVVVPELRRRGHPSAAATWRPLRKLAFPMSASAVAFGISALLIPRGWGELILGDSWTVVQPLLPITATEYAALAWLSAAIGGIMAQGRSADLLKLRLVFAGGSVALGSIAAMATGSARVVAGALAFTAVVAAVYARMILLKDPQTARSSEVVVHPDGG